MDIKIHPGYIPGCIGRISEMHTLYYSQLVGFGVAFEAKVARELAEFCVRYDEQMDGLRLVLGNDRFLGSFAIDGLHTNCEGAHLRGFLVTDKIRGGGIGNKSMEAAIGFCREKNYKQIYLNTFSGLDAARHLYEKFGFRLVKEELGAVWVKEVLEQRFEFND